MERSDYWQIVAQCWNKENRGRWPNGLAAKVGDYADVPQLFQGRRALSLENYLAVPTFLRRGCRVAL